MGQTTFVNETIISIEFDSFKSVSHILLAVFGVPLNLLIVVVILSNQRLKQKSRNVLLLGAFLSSLLALLTHFVEFLAYYYQSDFLCKVFGLSTGVAYTNLLYNLFLALICRYLAIARPMLHRKIVNVKKIIIIQVIGAVVIFFLFKWPYVFGFVPLQCGFILILGKITIAVTNAVLIFLIVILNIVVYIKTRHFIRPDRTVPVPYVNNRHEPINPTDDDVEADPQQATINLAPINSITADSTNNLCNNQQVRNKPSTKPSPSSAPRIHTNASHHNTPLQVHGGNCRMGV